MIWHWTYIYRTPTTINALQLRRSTFRYPLLIRENSVAPMDDVVYSDCMS